MFENFFKKQSLEKKKEDGSFYEKMINSPMKKLLVLSMLLSSSPKAEQKTTGSESTKRDPIEMVNNTAENKFLIDDDKAKHDISLDLQSRFIVKDENGEEKFSPWSILAPLQVNMEDIKKFENKITIEIPHFYSRQFDSAKEVDPESKKKLEEFILKQIKTELADNFFSLDPSDIGRKVYEQSNEGLDENNHQKYSVESISINGLASPEGPYKKGPSTIKSENEDKENVSLAELRANNVMPALIEALKRENINIDENLIQGVEIKGGEMQLSEQERFKIIEIAKKNNIVGFTDDELIFNAFVNFNNNQFTDNNDIEVLSGIINSKRNVVIEIKLKGEQKNVVSIPLPLLLLLPLFGFRRHFRRKDERPESVFGPEVDDGHSSDSGHETGKKSPLLLKESAVEPLYKDALEKINDSMVKQSVLGDLLVHIDNKKTIELGLDYRSMVEQINSKIEAYGQKELEEEVTAMIIEAWKQHDIAARKKAGFRESDLLVGLDYENNSEQIAWAIVHARELIRLAVAQERGGNHDSEFNKAFLMRCQELSR